MLYFTNANRFGRSRTARNVLFSRNYLNERKLFTGRQPKIKITAKLVQLAPDTWKPYLKLSRFDKPAATWLLYWPCCWGIASAADPGCLPDAYMLTLFGAGGLVMRGAGCTINDVIDRDVDSKVIRTMDRPLVNGDISVQQAWFYLAAQLSVALVILLQLNWYSIFLGSSSLSLMFVYPVIKRVTNFPQVILGLTVNWGTLLGYSAIHGNLNPTICIPLYAAAVTWTVIYDTIYAHQDRLDDLKVGVGSTAIYFGDKTKIWLAGLSVCMVSNLALSGTMNDQCWPYYASLAVVGAHLASQIATLDINDPNDCIRKFRSNVPIGFIVLCGIIFGTLIKNNK